MNDSEGLYEDYDERIDLLKEKIEKKSAHLEETFFNARDWYDRHELGRIVKSVAEEKFESNAQFAGYLGYLGKKRGSAISNAASRGAFSLPKYHRVALQYRSKLKAKYIDEGNDFGPMKLIHEIGSFDIAAKNKGHMNREKFEWLREIRCKSHLLSAIFSGNRVAARVLALPVQHHVRGQLGQSEFHSFKQHPKEDNGWQVVRPEQTGASRIRPNLDSLSELVLAWMPSYTAFDEQRESLPSTSLAISGNM